MISYHHAIVDGSEIFYREAGPKTAPTLLLLHGFPTSSHMFRNLIPILADRYHVVAPDLPGFGFTAAPDNGYTVDEWFSNSVPVQSGSSIFTIRNCRSALRVSRI